MSQITKPKRSNKKMPIGYTDKKGNPHPVFISYSWWQKGNCTICLKSFQERVIQITNQGEYPRGQVRKTKELENLHSLLAEDLLRRRKWTLLERA